jgi:hypothetical protein
VANKWVGAAAGLVGGQVAGRVLSVFLGSRSGERLLEAVDRRSLTPLEHRVLAQRWAGNIGKAISGGVATLFLLRGGDGGDEAPGTGIGTMGGRKINWIQVMQRTAEIMLAFGAIFKVVGEFLEDRERTEHETQRAAAKRLA